MDEEERKKRKEEIDELKNHDTSESNTRAIILEKEMEAASAKTKKAHNKQEIDVDPFADERAVIDHDSISKKREKLIKNGIMAIYIKMLKEDGFPAVYDALEKIESLDKEEKTAIMTGIYIPEGEKYFEPLSPEEETKMDDIFKPKIGKDDEQMSIDTLTEKQQNEVDAIDQKRAEDFDKKYGVGDQEVEATVEADIAAIQKEAKEAGEEPSKLNPEEEPRQR